jgi:beta-glucosidase
MITKKFLPLLFTSFLFAQVAPHKDVKKSFEARAKYIVSKMTLEEKVSQMTHKSAAIDRLEIPAMNYWNECLHGVARAGVATVFPQAIGMGAMFDKNHLSKVSNAISDEARANNNFFVAQNKRGIYQGLTFWTPNINIFRDPRWGRGMETYGEDPYLSGVYGTEFIKGLQGNDPKYLKLVGTMKHFVVHSGPESERHKFDATPSLFDFRKTYTPQFEMVAREGKPYSVMCAYNRYMGKPCCGNIELSNLLRNEWGFNGYIVSDCWAIKDFYAKDAHGFSKTAEEASAVGIKSGTDINCGDEYPALTKAVKDGLLSEAELDVSLERLIVARMKLGLFAPKGAVKYEKIPYSVLNSKAHKQLALETSRKSMVLLKNENSTLPLNKNVKKVAVIGPNADKVEILLGNYNGFPTNPITPFKGIKDKLPNAEVKYALGCKLAPGLPELDPVPSTVLFTDASLKTNGLNAEYYANTEFKGTPSHVQVDKNVDFTWQNKAPFKDLKYDKYSAKWSGYISVAKTDNYILSCEGNVKMKLYIDEEQLVDVGAWGDGPVERHVTKKLEANKAYKVRIEYVHDSEYAIARFQWEAPRTDLEQEAMTLAKESDVIIMCMGLSPRLEGEEMEVKVDGFSGGDRLDVKLPPSQTDLMKKLKTLGKPMVLVMLNGSAVGINWENDNVPAILEAWYPGQAGGKAIADILFGDYNPGGRLPLTFYKDINDIPAFNDYNMKGKTYRYFQGKPLYEFGYGLSYSTFKYSNLVIPAVNPTDKEILVSVNVTNTSKRAGEEVTEVYYSDSKKDENNTIRSLVGFQRNFLKAGETKKLTFKVKPKQIAQLNAEGKLQNEAGQLLFSVGGAQPNEERIAAGQVVVKNVELKGITYKIAN